MAAKTETEPQIYLGCSKNLETEAPDHACVDVTISHKSLAEPFDEIPIDSLL